MRAWVIEEHGGPEVFKEVELPTPEPGPGEVRIKVAATSVNPVDYKIRSGPAEALCPPKPAILHGDVAGIVDKVGEGVEHFKFGDQVYGCIGGCGKVQGVLSKQAIVDADLIAHAPRSLTHFLFSAALPLVTITAWEGLDKARADIGQHILIHGGTGGVGHVAIQLAKARGLRVSTTVSSEEKAKLATQLGADHTINYKDEFVPEYVDRLTQGEGFDIVFDTVGGSNIRQSIDAARLNGQVICIQGRSEIDGGLLHARGVSLHLVFMLIPILHNLVRARHGEILRQAASLVDEGKLKPLLDHGGLNPRFMMDEMFMFEDLPEAHAKAESGEAIGKVLIRM